MPACVAQAPEGRIDWSANEHGVSKQTGPNGAIWADVTQSGLVVNFRREQ